MLADYIQEQIDSIKKKIQNLNKRLIACIQEEAEDEKKIQLLLENEDVGLELFSPRNADSKVKTQVAKIQQHIEELRYHQAEMTGEIEKLTEEESNWQKNLEELQEKERSGGNTPDNTTISGQLQEILDRLNDIAGLMDKDHDGAKSQLQKLTYYLKALIAQQIEKAD